MKVVTFMLNSPFSFFELNFFKAFYTFMSVTKIFTHFMVAEIKIIKVYKHYDAYNPSTCFTYPIMNVNITN